MANKSTAKADLVSIFVPKVAGEDPILWVGLNGESWSIPRGKRTEVPADVAEIVYQKERNMQIADDFAAEKQRDLQNMMAKFQ